MPVWQVPSDREDQEDGVIMFTQLREWIKVPANMIGTALVTLSTAVIVGVSVTAAPAEASPDVPTLPVCVHVDASGQSACLWDASEFGSDHPDALVFDSGKITFYPHTGELAVWDDNINDVVVYKITDAR